MKMTIGVNFINILRAAFAPNSFGKKLQSQTVTREKLPKTLSYRKGTHKMLMKLTTRTEKGKRELCGFSFSPPLPLTLSLFF